MLCYIGEQGLVHVFDVATPTPRDARCDCGAVTWGEMDDLLTLTTMWELPPNLGRG